VVVKHDHRIGQLFDKLFPPDWGDFEQSIPKDRDRECDSGHTEGDM
jgi:hypothetical protein